MRSHTLVGEGTLIIWGDGLLATGYGLDYGLMVEVVSIVGVPLRMAHCGSPATRIVVSD